MIINGWMKILIVKLDSVSINRNIEDGVCKEGFFFMVYRIKKFVIVVMGIDRMLIMLCNIDIGRFFIEVFLLNLIR